jgi:tetratricopeptide (TPR) repeat protein
MTRLTILIALALVMGPMLALDFVPAEIARWYAAAAQDAEFDGDAERAIEGYTKAIAWDGHNAMWRLMRAEVHLAREDRDAAVADCQGAIAIRSRSPEAQLTISNLALELGMVDEALAANRTASETAIWIGPERRASLFNQRAYILAVSNRELKEAMSLVEHSLQLSKKRSVGEANALDTRGFLNYRMNNHEAAIKDFNEAIAAFEQSKRNIEDGVRATIIDKRRFDAAQAGLNRALAVMHYHRSLAHDKLGHSVEAAIDRQKVRDLGYRADENLF